MNKIQISIVAEKLFTLGGILPVSNTILVTWMVMIFLTLLSLLVFTRMKLIPGFLQSIMEVVVEGIWNLFESVLGAETRRYFPLLATLFFFIIFLNWVELLPGVGTIGLTHIIEGHKEFIPILRPGTADLNTTLALAFIAVIFIEIAGLRSLGLGYLRKFINLSSPVYFFVGILELISELSRIISFSFRLFGNIFAGDVLLTVIAFFIPLLAPLPFLGLELFVGFIQALVFAMLTAVFLSIATAKEEH